MNISEINTRQIESSGIPNIAVDFIRLVICTNTGFASAVRLRQTVTPALKH